MDDLAALRADIEAMLKDIRQQQEQIATLQQSFLGMVAKMRQVVASVHTHEADKQGLIMPDALKMTLQKGRKDK